MLFAQAADDIINTKISIDAKDASLSSVIQNMAKMSGCNIVLAVDGEQSTQNNEKKDNERRISITLKDVPLEQAVGLVVKTVGLSYRVMGEKTFIVGDKKRISEEVGERSYVIQLNYIDAKKAEKALKILPGEVSVVEGINALIVNANPETFADISKKIEMIDVPVKQIELRARLIEVNISDAKKMGIDWSRLNHLTTIIAEDPVNADGVGLPYDYSDPTGAMPHGESNPFAALPEEQYFQKMSDFDDAFKFSRQLYAFDITVDWLLSNNAAKILTDTRITTMNGENASIFIGEEIPYVARVRDNEYEINDSEVGIKLDVTPSINSDGQITAKIYPEVSSIVELVDGYLPRKKTRQLNSTVTVPSGTKVNVGGLLSSKTFETTNKVPFLGDLPWIGRFFQHKVEQIDQTDLIIEITPRLVTVEDMISSAKVDERMERRLIEMEEQE
jgi:type IV pilus assembly protein PilQ